MAVGVYRPSGTDGVRSAADLPKPTIVVVDRNQQHADCPACGHVCYRDRVMSRELHDVGDLRTGRPCVLKVEVSQHCCSKCKKYFCADTSDLAPPRSGYTHRVIDLALRTVIEDGMPYRPASWRLWRDHRVFVPFATIQNWVEAAGKKASPG
jgi:hypothetical protein